MTRAERWLQAAVTCLGSATAILAALLGYSVVVDLRYGWGAVGWGDLKLLALFLGLSLGLLLIAALIAVPVRRSAGWHEAMEAGRSGWRGALSWVVLAYGRGVRQGLGVAAALAVLLFVAVVIWL